MWPSLVWVGITHILWRPGWNKKREEGRNHSLSLLSWNISFFSCPWTGTHTIGSPGSQASRLGMKPQHLFSRVSNLLMADCGLLSLHNQMSEFLVINLSVSLPILTHWKRLWCWEGLGAGGEGDDRGWDGWMASLTRWTWVWVNSGGWWWTGRPGVLRFMGSQRAGHDWATELNWIELNLLLVLLLWNTLLHQV